MPTSSSRGRSFDQFTLISVFSRTRFMARKVLISSASMFQKGTCIAGEKTSNS